MRTKKWLSWLMLFLGLGLLLTACGEDNTGDPPGTLPTTTLSLADCATAASKLNLTAAATTGSTATPNPSGGPRVDVPPGFKLFLSSSQPYAVAVPPDWDIKERQSQGNIKDADLYIIKKNSNSGAFITVISTALKVGSDSKAFFDAQYKEAQANTKTKFDQQPNRQVGGSDAYIVAYNSQGGQGLTYPTQTVQILFAAQNQGWVVTFTASPNQAVQYCPYFVRVLDSWAFTGLVK